MGLAGPACYRLEKAIIRLGRWPVKGGLRVASAVEVKVESRGKRAKKVCVKGSAVQISGRIGFHAGKGICGGRTTDSTPQSFSPSMTIHAR